MDFFRGNTAQSAASWNGILHTVIFRERPRFVQKLRILSTTVEQLEREFSESADEIVRGSSAIRVPLGALSISLHYDFSTCLRETEVILKIFPARPSGRAIERFQRGVRKAKASSCAGRIFPARLPNRILPVPAMGGDNQCATSRLEFGSLLRHPSLQRPRHHRRQHKNPAIASRPAENEPVRSFSQPITVGPQSLRPCRPN